MITFIASGLILIGFAVLTYRRGYEAGYRAGSHNERWDDR